MAFDGTIVHALLHELQNTILGGRITKISQPEPEELLITIKNEGRQYRLFLSANAGLPLVYLTENNKTAPLTAPNFCMLLRKHIGSGVIEEIEQPDFERILRFKIRHLDELGDVRFKYLIVELMGKHSNIIFCDEQLQILDSLKRVSWQVSSVREVLPGKPYFIVRNTEKQSPLAIDRYDFLNQLMSADKPLFEWLLQGFTGISPMLAEEFCAMAGLPSSTLGNSLTLDQQKACMLVFDRLRQMIESGEYELTVLLRDGHPQEYGILPLIAYGEGANLERRHFDSVSTMLETYYKEKNIATLMRQKSTDLRKVISNLEARSRRKLGLLKKQLADTEKRDQYKVYGELLLTYAYSVISGSKSTEVFNYYTNETVHIPLQEELSAAENANRYFEKYNKMKRTAEATAGLLAEAEAEHSYLESVLTNLDFAKTSQELEDIRSELERGGYVKRKITAKGRKNKLLSKPLHFTDAEGNHYYVGKNNLQNEELTFCLANSNDWWFHAKQIPGSHVILLAAKRSAPSDEAFENAARLAAHFSKTGQSDKVEIDYIQRKFIKKPPKAKPGYVIYHTNYSMVIDKNIEGLTLLGD
ncbi:MAG: NFACT RNA binding domain-containing protein [Lachnospiraceae bacterium]|nr:NFACT RNA binding domain-containing protein [Lachnospiraceae bacterium]MDY5742510.1 NFACT RNA binding domain-containing protein [Lachnospiraceae bacterium]